MDGLDYQNDPCFRLRVDIFVGVRVEWGGKNLKIWQTLTTKRGVGIIIVILSCVLTFTSTFRGILNWFQFAAEAEIRKTLFCRTTPLL